MLRAFEHAALARHGYAPVGTAWKAYRQVFCFPDSRPITAGAGFDFSRHPFAALADEIHAAVHAPQPWLSNSQPDACAVLDALRAQGMRQAGRLSSASKRENLQQQVEHFGLRSRFDTLLGLSDIYAKSKTEVGLRWLAGKSRARTRPAS